MSITPPKHRQIRLSNLAFREMIVDTETERRPGYGEELGGLHFFTRVPGK